MLIRQKAGWRLHHQAYLWPRRCRTSSLHSPLSSSLLLPRRRVTGGAAVGGGGSTVPLQTGSGGDDDDGLPSPLSLRRNSGGDADGDDVVPTSPSSSTSSCCFCSPRSQKESSELCGNDSCSPALSLSSSGACTPRRRASSSTTDAEADGSSSPLCVCRSAAFDRRGSLSSDGLEDCSPLKQARRLFGGDGNDGPPAATLAAGDSGQADCGGPGGRREDGDGTGLQPASFQSRLEALCPGIQTRRDTRSGDSKGVESLDAGSSNNPLKTCKGSSSNYNNNHLPHLGSSSSPLSATLQGAATSSKMGVLCTEKHDLGQRCDCQNMAASSPRPASVNTTPASPCESNTSSSDSVRRIAASRKRSLDAALHQVDSTAAVAAARRRTHRSPSMGSVNGVVQSAAAATNKEAHSKLSTTIAVTVMGQNGLKREAGPNGVKLAHGYQNGTRPLCCLGLDALAPGSKGMAHHHHPSVVITALSSPSSTLPTSAEPVVAASPVCLPGQDSRGVTIGHNPGSTAAALSRAAACASNSVTSAGSTCHLAGAEDTGSKRPQEPSSSLSPLTNSSSTGQPSSPLLAQTLPSHPTTQGSPSSSINNGSSIITNSSIDSHDDRNNNSSSNCSISSYNTVTSSTLSSSSSNPSSTSSTSKSISASANSTVLSLRQRPLCSSSSSNISSNNATTQKSLSQPASPQPSCSSSTSLTTSSSLPSLSTLVTDPPPSPSPPPAVAQCRWRDCSCELDASDLLEHIRKHVEAQIQNKTYACLWADCKVFNKASWSASWLERHMVSHSGHRPFKCILDNCGQRFHSQAALERHVNGHFAAPSQNGVKTGRTREDLTHRMLQKRKKQMKRRFVQAVKRNDYIDDQTMVVIKHELVSLAEDTQLDLVGSLLQTTFHGSIVGRRSTKSGSKEHLLEFQPNHVLEEKWFPEEESKRMARMSVPLTSLPKDILFNLHNSIYRPHRFRKHRRK